MMAVGMTATRAGKVEDEQSASHHAAMTTQPQAGSVRTCMTYRDELLRHRVVTPDGRDFAVATHMRPGGGFITGAYPVQQGYLVMVRQPLYEVGSETLEAAHAQHDQLVNVLADAGVRIVRARRALAARQRSENRDTQRLGVISILAAPTAKA